MANEEKLPSDSRYPIKRGSYEIDNYLFAGRELQPAAWVEGRTLYGDIQIDHQAWATFSRPVFAYLSFVDTFQCFEQKSRAEAMVSIGYGTSFRQGLRVDYRVAPAIDRVNTLSELSTGFEPRQAWSMAPAVVRTIPLRGPGKFVAYQLQLVYAHCARSAAGRLASVFHYHQQALKGKQRDLWYLSEIATSKVVVVPAQQAISALGWDAVQRIVLLEGYRAADNSGRWSMDFSACARSYQCY